MFSGNENKRREKQNANRFAEVWPVPPARVELVLGTKSSLDYNFMQLLLSCVVQDWCEGQRNPAPHAFVSTEVHI